MATFNTHFNASALWHKCNMFFDDYNWRLWEAVSFTHIDHHESRNFFNQEFLENNRESPIPFNFRKKSKLSRRRYFYQCAKRIIKKKKNPRDFFEIGQLLERSSDERGDSPHPSTWWFHVRFYITAARTWERGPKYESNALRAPLDTSTSWSSIKFALSKNNCEREYWLFRGLQMAAARTKCTIRRPFDPFHRQKIFFGRTFYFVSKSVSRLLII